MSLLWPVKVYGYCVSDKFICTARFKRLGYRLISQVVVRIRIGALLFCFALFQAVQSAVRLQSEAPHWCPITVEMFSR